MKKNLFIAFEGIDGSGKSTQVKLLADNMVKAGMKVHTTFEPTKSPIGSIIRNIMTSSVKADHRTIAALFVADRLNHLLNDTDGILKMMNEGYSVITDRYYFSSYAYQGTHIPMDWVVEANSLSAQILKPDLNIFIDVSPELSMQRLDNGRASKELYETRENLENVRKKYFEAFERLMHEEQIIVIDGNRAPEHIAAEIWKNISAIESGRKTGAPQSP